MQIAANMPRVAYVLAFVMAGAAIVSAVSGPIVLLPFALIPLVAGVGILRRRVWSAYGFAAYLFAQIVAFVAVYRGSAAVELIATIALTVVLGCVFLFAGRSMASRGGQRGRPLPWIAISALCSLPLLFFQSFFIPTSAMEDTLLIGDCILVQRFPRRAVTRGDVIVFAYPPNRRETSVKRIVGISGDRIRISRKVLYRNGTALKEAYAVHKTGYEDPYRDNFPSNADTLFGTAEEMLKDHVVNGEVVVPEGCYFVLGDNRDSSLDSRYWGFVRSGDVIGKPLLIYDSADKPTENLLDERSSRRNRTRWERLFKIL